MGAGELAAATQLRKQLQHALDTRIVIEHAKGMLDCDHDVDVDQAFKMLRNLSRNRSTPLRTIADAVITSAVASRHRERAVAHEQPDRHQDGVRERCDRINS